MGDNLARKSPRKPHVRSGASPAICSTAHSAELFISTGVHRFSSTNERNNGNGVAPGCGNAGLRAHPRTLSNGGSPGMAHPTPDAILSRPAASHNG